LAGRDDILEAFQRLHIRCTPRHVYHSSAMVSTAGALIGSYNFIYAARVYNHAQGILLGPDDAALAVQNQLKARLELASPIDFGRFRANQE